jgi:hypothetical protein
LVQIQPGPPSTCPCSSVVEHSLGKGEVTSSNLVKGLQKEGLAPLLKQDWTIGFTWVTLRCLIVEDQVMFLQLLCKMLQGCRL